MNAEEKATVLQFYEEGDLSDRAARILLGDGAFEASQEMARGADMMLSGDTGRFLSNNPTGDQNRSE